MIEDQIREMATERTAALRAMRPFDAGLWLGRPEGFPLARELTAGTLGEAMQACGITGGLVSHWDGKTRSPQHGNARLLAEDLPAGTYRAVTGLPLFPPEGGPLPGAGDLPENVRAVRLFPRTHGYPLAGWILRTLIEWMIGRGLPLFAWHTELQWTELYSFAREYPSLSMIVESQPRKIIYHARPLLALLKACPNVSLEISNATGPLIGMALEQLGPDRLVYGSFLPANDPLVPLGILLDSGLSPADCRRVAGDNLRRLVEGGGR